MLFKVTVSINVAMKREDWENATSGTLGGLFADMEKESKENLKSFLGSAAAADIRRPDC